MAAETPLHDLGAISMVSSDSLGMGRIGETIQRTWQMAHMMHRDDAQAGAHANSRVLRYLAKYTINPALTHGLSQHVGSLEPGKLADIVLWHPACFGVKPHLVLKGGMPAWGALGDGNAAIETAQPLIYGPLFGGHGSSAAPLSLTFVAQAALDARLPQRLKSRRLLQPVHNTRAIRKTDMLFNDQTPLVHVDASTHAVTIQGQTIAVEPAESVPLSRLYFLS
jgi:urease subunit alpha